MAQGGSKYTVHPTIPGLPKRILASYEKIVKDVGNFGVDIGDALRTDPRQVDGFIRECVAATSVIFQKWNLEIFYLLALLHRLRYSQLKTHLVGISSRTLSLKLDELQELGFLQRDVYPEKPLRVEYSLTDAGRTMARLTLPLVVFLNMRRGLRVEDGVITIPQPE